MSMKNSLEARPDLAKEPLELVAAFEQQCGFVGMVGLGEWLVGVRVKGLLLLVVPVLVVGLLEKPIKPAVGATLDLQHCETRFQV